MRLPSLLNKAAVCSLVIGAFFGKANADECCPMYYPCVDFYDCCDSDCFGPVKPCSWSFTMRGGFAPGLYTDRQKLDFKNIVAICEVDASVPEGIAVETSSDLVVQTAKIRSPTFNHMFDIPWTAGGELSYAFSCNTEFFIDGNYLKANGKHSSYTVEFDAIDSDLFDGEIAKPAESIRVSEKYGNLESYDGFIGFRYYFPRCCCVSFFCGSKIGFRHWDSIKAKVTLQDTYIDPDTSEETTDTLNLGRFTWFPSQTVVSGGFQIGINYSLCDCVELVLQAEAIASGPFKFRRRVSSENLLIDQVLTDDDTDFEEISMQTAVDFPVRRMGTIFTFPVTLGLRLTF